MDKTKRITKAPWLDDSADALDRMFARDAENPAVCVVDGYGIQITTSSGRLKVCDGIGTHRRERKFSRANHGLARLVVLGATGVISIEAIHWLNGAGVAFIVLDPGTGQVLSSSAVKTYDDARVRRAQALATGTETGMAIARYLTGLKLAGQAAVADHDIGAPTIAVTINELACRLDDASTLEEIRQIEATAANLYWSAWETVTVTYVAKDKTKVPENWRLFEGRRSAINPGGARNASDPINALLNYSFRLLEAEGHLSTMAMGIDPSLGVLHADIKGRASFVLDLIEAARPMAERHVLRLIRSQPLRWRDFNENSRGVVRVLPPLTHRLAEAMPGYASVIGPVIEHVAQLLASASPYDVTSPSILTKVKHKEAARRRIARADQDFLEASPPAGPGVGGMIPRKKRRQKPRVQREPSIPLPICKGCGVTLHRESDRVRTRETLCPTCLVHRRAAIGATLPALARSALGASKETNGVRPTHSPTANKRRSEANGNQRAEEAEWEATHFMGDLDSKVFTEGIFPHLGSFTLTEIARAIGVSSAAASKIRAGRSVPHPRHWQALAGLANAPLAPLAVAPHR